MNLPTSDDTQQPSMDLSEQLTSLRDRLSSDSEKKQLEALADIESLGTAGVDVLMDYLSKRHADKPTFLDGKAYQVLVASGSDAAQAFLNRTFPNGLVPLQSEQAIDYHPLQDLLIQQKFEDADRLTLQKLCELAGEAAMKRKWIYFSEVNLFPITDLRTIDLLWSVYSEGKFGFSVQREIWLALGKDWDRLWPKIGWRNANTWTRYPNEFTWDVTAPRGHLPLSNQLRGVRVMESIMNHPAWQ